MSDPDKILPNEVKCPNCSIDLELSEQERQKRKFNCPKCNMVVDMTNESDVKMKKIEPFTPEWANHLEERLKNLELEIQTIKSKLPSSNIIHPKFWKRAWTVFGYGWATMGLIYGVLFGFSIIIAIIQSLS